MLRDTAGGLRETTRCGRRICAIVALAMIASSCASNVTAPDDSHDSAVDRSQNSNDDASIWDATDSEIDAQSFDAASPDGEDGPSRAKLGFEGGVVDVDAYRFELAPGAVTEDLWLGAMTLDLDEIPISSEDADIVSGFELLPDGATFAVPARVTFPIYHALAAGTALDLIYCEPGTNDSSETGCVIEGSARVDASGLSATGEFRHFSNWWVRLRQDVIGPTNAPTVPPGGSITRSQTVPVDHGGSESAAIGDIDPSGAANVSCAIPYLDDIRAGRAVSEPIRNGLLLGRQVELSNGAGLLVKDEESLGYALRSDFVMLPELVPLVEALALAVRNEFGPSATLRITEAFDLDREHGLSNGGHASAHYEGRAIDISVVVGRVRNNLLLGRLAMLAHDVGFDYALHEVQGLATSQYHVHASARARWTRGSAPSPTITGSFRLVSIAHAAVPNDLALSGELSFYSSRGLNATIDGAGEFGTFRTPGGGRWTAGCFVPAPVFVDASQYSGADRGRRYEATAEQGVTDYFARPRVRIEGTLQGALLPVPAAETAGAVRGFLVEFDTYSATGSTVGRFVGVLSEDGQTLSTSIWDEEIWVRTP